jgi:antirestriction protein
VRLIETLTYLKEEKMSDYKIYVACLAAYNNGYLHGQWIDLDQPLDDVWNAIRTMLKTSPIPDAEEWAIHDYEGIENAHALAQFILEHGELGGLMLNHMSGDLALAQSAIEDNYQGKYTSLADYAEELTTDTTEIPSLRYGFIVYV